MKENIQKIILLCSTGIVLLGGGRAIPLLEEIKIGSSQPPAADAAAAVMPAETTALPEIPETVQSGTVTQPERFAPAEESADDSLIINRESDGSAAMWYSRLYQTDNSGEGGQIIDKHYGAQSGTMFFSLPGGGQVRNSTFWSNAELLKESAIAPELDLKIDGSPMVLIYHTHTTESYVSEKTGTYSESFNFRTTEPDKNMVAVGDAIAEQLSEAGIGVVHAREIHDFPVWTGSYNNSAETIRAILAEYPSICIALDIHRDAISSGGTVYAPVAAVNDRQSAQIMIISGCDDGTMGMPDYRENFHFASRLQQTAESMFPGFTRPLMFDYRKYNQDLTTGSLLIEVGSQGNTLEEARYAGELTGQALAETIRQLSAAREEEMG